ncbi:TIGR02677 family protein [Actinocorallia sp. A-T 12471]|uniref:TIGR02677 family protein n=1 Tax=Actinocorallia sp. A-T 12471 TaxID=3089813 RepID=UPI0029CCBE9B|nr:TIGR02677 family protein [Actinocorallia sp. A-T 12471]MDX6738759.1 TIGR02677 family protein [Actinocorallia sp. A-T 12471]
MDGIAVGDRLGLLAFARREDARAYLWVLRAIDRLRSGHRVQVGVEEVAGVLREFAAVHEEVPALEGVLRDRLDVLWEDGLLHRHDDVSRAGSLARYRNRQSVYQFSELGYRAYTLVEDLLAARVRDVNLSRLAFSEVLADLRALAQANRLGEGRKVLARLSRLDEAMEDMARRSARFHVTLGEIVSMTEASPEEFLRYKNALLAHMREFMDELDRYLPRLERAVREVEETGVVTMLTRAADADDRPLLAPGERMADWEQRWAGLRGWFVPGPDGRSGVAELHAATRTAVSAVIAMLYQLSEVGRSGVDRASELRHLAAWLARTPDEDAAHALATAAFNLTSARHLGAAHEDEERIDPGSTWWDAPGVEVALTPFRTGRQAGPGAPQPVKADTGARAELRRRQAAEFAAERGAARGLAERAPVGRPLDEDETRVLLRLLTKALEARTVISGRLESASGSDDIVVLRLRPAERGDVVRVPGGSLHLPGFALEVETLERPRV